MHIEALYLDMDGVLADFQMALRNRGVIDNEPEFHHKPREEWTESQKVLDGKVRDCMDALDFWNNIPPMLSAHALWQYALTYSKLYVLTALPRVSRFPLSIESQKRDWIQRYLGPFPNDRVIVCKREQKKLYAKPGHVLVDDMMVNCEEWRAAGGTAIHFTSARQAIRELIHLSAEPDAPILRDKTSAERKGEPIHTGVMLYFPDALAAVARISKAGNDKHNPGEPLHWARGKSMDQMDAAARHMLTLDKIDPESGELEAAHNAWRSLAQLQLLEEQRLAAAGIRPYSGIVP